MSMNWLSSWKQFVSFNRVVVGKQPNFSTFAKNCESLATANVDLVRGVIGNLKSEYYDFKQKDNIHIGAMIVLKPNLREAIDYVIIDKTIIHFFL